MELSGVIARQGGKLPSLAELERACRIHRDAHQIVVGTVKELAASRDHIGPIPPFNEIIVCSPFPEIGMTKTSLQSPKRPVQTGRFRCTA